MKQTTPIPSEKQEIPMDEVLRRMLSTPPKPKNQDAKSPQKPR